MKILQKFFQAFAVCFFLAGCGTIPPLNFSVPNVGISEHKIDGELKSLMVTVARPDEKSGEIPFWIEATIPQLWNSSLLEAINRMVIFQDDSKLKLNLFVKILKMDVPSFGASMTTDVSARYELMNRKNGDIIFTQDISTDSTVPFNHAFMGVARSRESINRAVQNNITVFLQSLETVDITKPMFPTEEKK